MVATVATLVLIVGVSVGITLALLSAKTNKKENTFTGSKGVQGSTYETSWDDSTPEDPTPDDKPDDPYYGINESDPYTPGMVINKNPQVANLSVDEEVWVMMRVEYTINGKEDAADDATKIPVTYSEFSKLARISVGDAKNPETGEYINGSTGTESVSDNWQLYTVGAISDNAKEKELWTSGTEPSPNEKDLTDAFDNYYKVTTGVKEDNHIYYYYYYKLPLDKKTDDAIASTATLFDTVHINSQTADYDNIFLSAADDDEQKYAITNIFDSKTYYTYSNLPEFSINVESAIIARDTLKDPSQLGASESGKTPDTTILASLKSVFDAYDAKN